MSCCMFLSSKKSKLELNLFFERDQVFLGPGHGAFESQVAYLLLLRRVIALSSAFMFK